MFQINIEGQSGLKYPTFPVPIVNSKDTHTILKIHWFNIIEMFQIVISSVVYHMHSLRHEKNAARDIVMRI